MLKVTDKMNKYELLAVENSEVLKRNLSSSKSSSFSNSNVSLTLLLSNSDDSNENLNGYLRLNKHATYSEPVRRKVYGNNKKQADKKSSRNSGKSKGKRKGTIDKEALDRFKYFKSLCAIKPNVQSSYNNFTQEIKHNESIKSSNENIRKYFEDLSNHENSKFILAKQLLSNKSESGGLKQKANINFTEKKNLLLQKRSSCIDLSAIESDKTITSSSSISSTSSIASQDAPTFFHATPQKLTVSHNRVRNIEVSFENLPEKINEKEKENNFKKSKENELVKSEKFKFPKFSLKKQEQVEEKPMKIEFKPYRIEELSYDSNDDDFEDSALYGLMKSRNYENDYQGLTRQNRMVFFDGGHQNLKKEKQTQKQIPVTNNNDYIANLPYLPKENEGIVKKNCTSINMEPSDISEDNYGFGKHFTITNGQNSNRLSKVETLSVITEEDSEFYFPLKSPLQLASNSSANLSSNSQIFNRDEIQTDLFIIEALTPISNNQKLLKTEKPNQKQVTVATQKVVSPFIKSKMSIFEVEKTSNKIIKNSIGSNNRFQNLNIERAKHM